MFCGKILLAIALVASFTTSQLMPIPPKHDPWYQAPAGYELTQPSAVLRLRPAPGNLTSIFNESSTAWNILFRTTDSNYQPTWAVTTLFAPKNHSSTSPSLVSYQVPYNTPDLNASPSYALYDTNGYNLHGPGQFNDIQTLLRYGYFVTAPDHEGPLASFGCAVSEGHTVLDAIRAVKSLGESFAPPKDARVALMGYSGGSLASEFAAELQVQYAPELKIAGAAVGGLITNVSLSFQLVSGAPLAGFIPAILVGMSKQHPPLNQTLFASLKQNGPYNATAFFSINDWTSVKLVDFFRNQDLSQYFTNGTEFFASPSLAHATNTDALMGYHGTPQMALFVYHAVHDELSPIAETDALVDRYCRNGANILYRRNEIGGHLDEFHDDTRALQWVHGVLQGTYNNTGCRTENVAVNLTGTAVQS